MSAGKPVALATFQKRSIVVYNDDGTVNLGLTRQSGEYIAAAAHRVQNLVAGFPVPADVNVAVSVSNVYCSVRDDVVFWDGLTVHHGDICILCMQFAYKSSQGCFPVKGTEVGASVQHFGRSWTMAARYISEIFERLHRGNVVVRR